VVCQALPAGYSEQQETAPESPGGARALLVACRVRRAEDLERLVAPEGRRVENLEPQAVHLGQPAGAQAPLEATLAVRLATPRSPEAGPVLLW
jgi:hypothetical protein